MSATCFQNNPKGDFPHYSFIFRKLDPLGKELKNAARSRLGTMLYPDIQNGKEAMKVSDYKQEIGGMYDCMKIVMKVTKGCGQM